MKGTHSPLGDRSPAICPHCWNVNPGKFRLCGRCGADMSLLLQESGGLRRVPAVQSPVPVGVSRRLRPGQRLVLMGFVLLLAAWYLLPLLGSRARVVPSVPSPAAQGL